MFEISSAHPIKSHRQKFREDILKCKRKCPFHPLSQKFVHTFDWRLEISNGFLEMKANLIFQLFLVQMF